MFINNFEKKYITFKFLKGFILNALEKCYTVVGEWTVRYIQTNDTFTK